MIKEDSMLMVEFSPEQLVQDKKLKLWDLTIFQEKKKIVITKLSKELY